MNAAHVPLAESFRLLLPEILLAVFFLIALLLDAGGRSRRILLAAWTMLGFALAGVLAVMQRSVADAHSPGVWIFKAAGAPYGTGLLVVDRFAIYFKILIAAAGIVVTIISLRSEELIDDGGSRIGEYFALMLAMGCGMFLMVGASDLLTAYMSVEIVSLASYAAVCVSGGALRPAEASMKYLIHGAVSTGIMLFGISLVYGLIGSTSFSTILGELGRRNAEIYLLAPVLLSALMILAGLGHKVAAVPFHSWAPDVYEGAPVTLTSFLAVASKVAGLALLIRFVIGAYPITLKVFNWEPIIAGVAAVTMTLGNLAALQQGNLKRLFAYSTIAQGGTMLAGLAAGSAYGVSAILISLPVYLVTTLGAFFAVQKIAEQIGSEEIEDYRGLGRRMPAAGLTLGIFLVAMIGLPPTAGFISRLFLFGALIDAGDGLIWLAVVAALNSVIALYYCLRILKVMYLERSSDDSYTLSLDRGSTVILGVFAVALVLFGLPPLFGPLVEAAQGSLGTLVSILR